MADLNTTYEGYNENYGMIQPLIIPSNGVNPEQVLIDQFTADVLNKDFKALNEESARTIAAVKLPFFGSTKAERVAWANERLKAVQERGVFIEKRVEEMAKIIKDNGQTSLGESLFKTFTGVFAAVVPVIGTTVSALTLATLAASKQTDNADAQQKIAYYQADIESLSAIQTALKKESATVANSTDSLSDIISNTATAWPTWYYIAGITALFLLFVWIRRRNQKRSKR